MQYLGELRQNWRPLLAAMIGMGSGMSMTGVITSTIAPSMVAANKWSPAEFALVGSLALLTSFVFPFVGRLADVLGVRRTALIGQVTVPLAFLAYSLMSGALWLYMVIFFIQSVFCVTTTATVYTRLPVQYVSKARGLALAIVASGPALSGIVMAPLLNGYVEHYGWRASYQALAIFAVIAGTITFLLIPPGKPGAATAAAAPRRRAREDYPVIFRTRAFWILLAAMLLCNLPQTILQVQLKLLLMANGVSGKGAAVMLTTVSIGMLAGRFVSGFALDRFRPYLVSFVTMGLPSVGLFLLASSLDTVPVLTFAVFCVGFAFGAEGDVVAYLVARQFGVGVYSTVMGLLTTAMSFSTASGAALLSFTMARTGGYDLYLVIVGTCVLAGASLLLTLGRGHEPTAEEKAIEETVLHPGVQITGQV
ncbi:MAG: MFS transporter [Sphingomonadales bacterium]|nr:MFS transporter [Sphingomonadales bacterium]